MINADFMLLGFVATARGIVTARLLVASGYGFFGAVVATFGLVSCLALPTFGLTDDFYLGTLTPKSLARFRNATGGDSVCDTCRLLSLSMVR
jgi:hypothetical protein